MLSPGERYVQLVRELANRGVGPGPVLPRAPSRLMVGLSWAERRAVRRRALCRFERHHQGEYNALLVDVGAAGTGARPSRLFVLTRLAHAYRADYRAALRMETAAFRRTGGGRVDGP